MEESLTFSSALDRSHTPTHAETGMVSTDGGREEGFKPQVLLLLPTTGPLLSYCMAAVSGIVRGGCSCVCSCSEPHRVPLCVLKRGTQMQKAAMEGEPLTTVIHSHSSSGRDVDAVIMLWLF